MGQPLLSDGAQEYVESPSDVETRLQEMRDDLEQFMEQTGAALTSLRSQMQIVRSALAQAAGETVVSSGASTPPQFDQRWEAWKQKLGNGTAPARVIDALLKHGPLNRTQLRQAGELGWSTLDAATSRLKNLSLIEKNGDRWNLKTS